MWYDNRVTEVLNINYPIVQAGMAGGVTTPELVAAVSNTGALGTLGAGYMSPGQMKETIQKIKRLTDRPFGVNIFIPEIPDVSGAAIEKANEWLQPFREALNLAEEPEIGKPSTSIFEQQMEVVLEERVPVCSFTFGVPAKETVRQLKKENIVVVGTATTVKEAVINEQNGMDMVVMQGVKPGVIGELFRDPLKRV